MCCRNSFQQVTPGTVMRNSNEFLKQMYRWTVLVELLAELLVTSQPQSCLCHAARCDAEVLNQCRCNNSPGTLKCAEANYRISDWSFQLLSVLNSSMDQAGRLSLTQNPLHSVTYWHLRRSFNSSQLVFHLIIPLFSDCPSLRGS